MTEEQKTNPMAYIIEQVFGVSQRSFAKMFDPPIAQPTVNRWVSKGFCHYGYQKEIRGMAKSRGLPWDSDWFFQAPSHLEIKHGEKREGTRVDLGD